MLQWLLLLRFKFDAEKLELEYTPIAPPSFATLFSKVQLETEALLDSSTTKAPPLVSAVFISKTLVEIWTLLLRCIRMDPPDSASFFMNLELDIEKEELDFPNNAPPRCPRLPSSSYLVFADCLRFQSSYREMKGSPEKVEFRMESCPNV